MSVVSYPFVVVIVIVMVVVVGRMNSAELTFFVWEWPSMTHNDDDDDNDDESTVPSRYSLSRTPW